MKSLNEKHDGGQTQPPFSFLVQIHQSESPTRVPEPIELSFGDLDAILVALTNSSFADFWKAAGESISLSPQFAQWLISTDQADSNANESKSLLPQLLFSQVRAGIRLELIDDSEREEISVIDWRDSHNDQRWRRMRAHPAVWESAQLLVKSINCLAARTRSEADSTRNLRDEKLKSMRLLAYGASHEINNPLANISARAQSLLAGETDSQKKRKLAAISAQAMRAHEMIANMMLFAKPPKPQLESVRVGEFLASWHKQANLSAAEQGTLLRIHDRSPDLIVNVDRNQLNHALFSLLRNSLEALGTGGRIDLTSSISDASFGKSWKLRLLDSGPGISAELFDHIFDPFFSGREAGRGLGFGLSVVWAIVQMHGGTIEVDNYAPTRVAFTIMLPV